MPKDYNPNAPENAPDMNRYYYRPGTTEPELRPEIAAAEAEAATKPATPLKGKLPEDFPGHSALDAEGLTSYAKVRKRIDAGTLTDVPGIGDATAEKIQEAMNESSPEEEEAE